MKLILPTQLQKTAGGKAELDIDGKTVNEAFQRFCFLFPSVKERILTSEGKINRFINVFVNDEDIRFLSGMETILKESDTITIVPAIAGG